MPDIKKLVRVVVRTNWELIAQLYNTSGKLHRKEEGESDKNGFREAVCGANCHGEDWGLGLQLLQTLWGNIL